MKFNPKTVTLKNRKEVRIRTAEISDAENLLATLKKYISDSAFIPKTSNEIIITVEQERDWISSFIQKDNSLLLVAEFENEIIGNIDLTGNPRIMMQHTAIIGMGMLTDWRNVGLGTLNRLFMAAELLHLNKEDWHGLRLGLVEELEAHLHPQAQMQVIEALQKHDQIQIILSTHSPNLASKVRLENS